MPVEMRIWRIDGERPRPLSTAVLPTEAALEDFLERDPSLLGTPLLVIGRQVRTPHGEFVDLLAIVPMARTCTSYTRVGHIVGQTVPSPPIVAGAVGACDVRPAVLHHHRGSAPGARWSGSGIGTYRRAHRRRRTASRPGRRSRRRERFEDRRATCPRATGQPEFGRPRVEPVDLATDHAWHALVPQPIAGELVGHEQVLRPLDPAGPTPPDHSPGDHATSNRTQPKVSPTPLLARPGGGQGLVSRPMATAVVTAIGLLLVAVVSSDVVGEQPQRPRDHSPGG